MGLTFKWDSEIGRSNTKLKNLQFLFRYFICDSGVTRSFGSWFHGDNKQTVITNKASDELRITNCCGDALTHCIWKVTCKSIANTVTVWNFQVTSDKINCISMSLEISTGNYRRFGWAYCFHIQVQAVLEWLNAWLTLKMRAESSF
jgi:hypothetical protein